jgi:hypothetical protein
MQGIGDLDCILRRAMNAKDAQILMRLERVLREVPAVQCAAVDIDNNECQWQKKA